MKAILKFIAVTTASLISVSSCKESDYASVFFSPGVGIEFTDMEGNDLFDKVIDSTDLKLSDFIEITSLTNETGASVSYAVKGFYQFYNKTYCRIYISIFETYIPDNSLKLTHEYTLKYKMPALWGNERTDEIKMTYNINIWGAFTESVYNGKKMKYFDLLKVFPPDPSIDSITLMNQHEESINMVHTGEPAAFVYGSSDLNLVIPVNREEIRGMDPTD
jgi:hypothetical protein